MNTALGGRIRSLRETKGLTQEQIAEKMKCTRQKYARLEKGQVDISYSSLVTIADILGIKVNEITSVLDNTEVNQPMYRRSEINSTNENDDKLKFITDMLDTFYAHRKLFYSVRPVDCDE